MAKRRVLRHMVPQYLATPSHPIKIILIGCGGTGSHVLSGLAQLNQMRLQLNLIPIHVTAYDPDIVTERNIGRQLFSPADINKNKAVLLIERINRFYGYSWSAMPERFNGENKSMNIVISCVDTVKSRKEIHTFIMKGYHSFSEKNYYWMDIGNNKTTGQIFLSTPMYKRKNTKRKDPNWLPTIFDEYPNLVDEQTDYTCDVEFNPYNQQSLFINKMMATYACIMLTDLLTYYNLTYRGIFVNLSDLSIKKIPI